MTISPTSVDDAGSEFTVRLANFEGPFDLLLQLIGKHKLDVTEVALSVVTDDFLAHIRRNLRGDSSAAGDAVGSAGDGTDDPARIGEYDLDETTEFLLVAATLLDLKAARLLPGGEVEDESDLDLLDARDLLFARLLQYRAYKQMAVTFTELMAKAPRRYARSVTLEERLARLLPDVLITLPPQAFAQLAARAMEPRTEPEIGVAHLHAPAVSVRDEADLVVSALRSRHQLTFADLIDDSPSLGHTVARFLAILELYRADSVVFEQADPLGALTIRWTGGDTEVVVGDEFDVPTQVEEGS
jgi:segregation and condensation protein A